jgi:hypothetical protein
MFENSVVISEDAGLAKSTRLKRIDKPDSVAASMGNRSDHSSRPAITREI